MPKFKKDVKFHEELRQCVLSTYNEKKFPIPEGYQVLERVENPKSGYYGLVLKKTTTLLLQGEELNNAIDFWMDEDKFV